MTAFTLPYLLFAPYANLQSNVVGFIYGSFADMAVAFTYLCIPEGQCRTLEEIEELFATNIPRCDEYCSQWYARGAIKIEEACATSVSAREEGHTAILAFGSVDYLVNTTIGHLLPAFERGPRATSSIER